MADSFQPDGDSFQADAAPGPAARLWSSFVASLPHPIDAITEWANRPAEVGKAMDALHELNQLHDLAAKDPGNKGKALNQWSYPPPSRAQQTIIDTGLSAQLHTPEGNVATDLSAPAVHASGQAASGDLAGAAGTLLGAYGAPAAVARIVGARSTIPVIKAAAAGTKEAIPALMENVSLKNPLQALRAVADVAGAVKQEYRSAMTDATAAAHRAANPGRVPDPIAQQPLANLSPISPPSGELPSGRMPGPAPPEASPLPRDPIRGDVSVNVLPDLTPIPAEGRLLPSGRRVPIPGEVPNPIQAALDAAKKTVAAREAIPANNGPLRPPLASVPRGTHNLVTEGTTTDLEKQLQASIEAAKKGKPNASVPSSPELAAKSTELKAQAAETSEGFKDAAQTRRALTIGKWLKDYLGEEPDSSLLTDEHIKAAAEQAGVKNPSSTTLQKVRELFSMTKESPKTTIGELMRVK